MRVEKRPFSSAKGHSLSPLNKLNKVVASYIHLREHIKHANLNLNEVKKFILRFVICEGLEADIYTPQNHFKIVFHDALWLLI